MSIIDYQVVFLVILGLTMANFGGHAIPGSFFLIYGFWLTVKYILHHYWRTNQPKGRQIMPPFFKRMEYIEGGFAMFAAFVGQFCSVHLHSIRLSQTCSRLISFGLLSRSRYYGWTDCGGWAACPPLWRRFMGQADELAAQHHVSVLWDLWDRHCCQYCIHTGAGWRWPPRHLLSSFCWRCVFSHTFFSPSPHKCVPLISTKLI